MNNLSANCERILEVLNKISKHQLLCYRRRKPKLSDLELIALSLTSEYMALIARMICSGSSPKEFPPRSIEVFIIDGAGAWQGTLKVCVLS